MNSNMVGERFGRLVVVSRLGSFGKGRDAKALWLCRCDCGREVEATTGILNVGHKRSCGCLRKEVARLNGAKGSETRTTHGRSYSVEYSIWTGIKSRCLCSGSTGYSNYGGRGIKICRRWMKFENFYADMGPRPTPQHSVDRVDSDGDYCPGNCRWATQEEQTSTRRNVRSLVYEGRTATVAEWARSIGITPSTLHERLRHTSVEEALSTPRYPNGREPKKRLRVGEAAALVVAEMIRLGEDELKVVLGDEGKELYSSLIKLKEAVVGQ